MNLDERDRGRLLLAAVLTVIAVPTVWLLNRDDDTGIANAEMNGAVVARQAGADGAAATPTAGADPEPLDPFGDTGAAILEPAVDVGSDDSVPQVAIGDLDYEVLDRTTATYGNIDPGTCKYVAGVTGSDITVVNVANGRQVDCEVTYGAGLDGGIVMDPWSFAKIAELVAAPIHVEIRT